MGRRKPGESAHAFTGRHEKCISAISAKDKELVAALREVIPAKSDEIDGILRHYANGWFQTERIWEDFVRRRASSGEALSSEVARRGLLERRMGRVPPEELLDRLTQWAIVERNGHITKEVAARFSARESLGALRRWAAAPGVAARLWEKGLLEEAAYFHFRVAVAPSRQAPLSWDEVARTAKDGPPVARWLAVRSLAYQKYPKAGTLALRLLREHGDLPFIERVAVPLLMKLPGTRLQVLDLVSRRISEGRFHEGNMGTYAGLGGACKKYQQGRRMLEFVRGRSHDAALLAWISKELAEIPGPSRSRIEEQGEKDPPVGKQGGTSSVTAPDETLTFSKQEADSTTSEPARGPATPSAATQNAGRVLLLIAASVVCALMIGGLGVWLILRRKAGR